MKEDIVVAWLQWSMDHMTFDGEEYSMVWNIRVNKYYEEVVEHLQQEPWTKEERIQGHPTAKDIYEEAELDLYDDFHNCGGVVMNRIWDIHCLHHRMPAFRARLWHFLANELEMETNP